jgi:hypothetical protein
MPSGYRQMYWTVRPDSATLNPTRPQVEIGSPTRTTAATVSASAGAGRAEEVPMLDAYAPVTIITIVANIVIALAGLARARPVLANGARVGVPETWVPFLSALKLAGATGLLLGLVGVPFIGTIAALGLVLFFVGAVATHVRARAYRSIGFPGSFLVLAIASLVLSVAR